MEGGGIFLDSLSEARDVAGEKAKRGKAVKGDSVVVGGSQKKMLTDITNLKQQQQQCLKSPLNQQAKRQSASLAVADISTDQLLKENAMLMKLLANRNAIIESCKAELQKSQTNFQKMRKQNSELALTNSQMLAELNANRQRMRELQHELGSKNGILKAMKLELTAKQHTENLKPEVDANEVGASQGKEPNQTFQEDDRGDNLCRAKRKRVSKSQSSAPAVVKQVKSTGTVDSQRYSLRRQSKAEKSSPTEEFFEVDEIKYDVSHLQENLAKESEQTSLVSKVHEEAREDTECNSSRPTNSESIHTIENIEKNRHGLRRQSARFKPEIPEPTEDFFEIDDAKFAVSHLCDNISEKSGPTTSSATSGKENKENIACKFDPREIRRSSVGRPLRRTVEKVQSYKEVPINVKMRRPN